MRPAAVAALQSFFLSGHDLILLDDDTSHDLIAQTLGIPTLYGADQTVSNVSNGGSPLFNGPFGTTSNVTQTGTIGQLSPTDMTNHGGHVGAINASGQVTAAYWNSGDTPPAPADFSLSRTSICGPRTGPPTTRLR